ncbi:Ig-like domain-containing protein [Nonomuraea rhodomycinica]|uniref:Ig-like domain-containing protein n=1 Tax=Nonomuraea rhodomycinica TaxID=1712872 RepID=A0A7Y6MF95_9ACTN|nr:Ig-like domain-containing protein [Nonomuraea rhodomycinica]
MGAQTAAVAGANAATGERQAVTRAAVAPCVRQGQANYPVEYYWKNALGMRLGSGSVSVVTSPSLWGGQIAPGSTFTLTLTHRTAQWPLLVSRYTTTWDLSSLLANATVVGESGTGSISGTTLSITSTGTKTDPSPKVITFQVKPGTAGRSMTIRPTGISSVIAAPGQLGGNTPAPPIQIVNGQSISPTKAVDDTATTGQGTPVSVPVLANDTATAPTISGVGKPAHGTATISGGKVVYTPDPSFAGTDSFTYTVTTPCGTSTAKVTVTASCDHTPVNLVNGSFEAPPVATVDWNIPDASTNPGVGWHTTAADRKLEFWRSGAGGGPSADGQQFAELNANYVSTLYQDLPTVPGTRMTWSLYHRGRLGTDVMQVLIGAPGAPVPQTPTGASSPDLSDDNTTWGHYTGVYVVPPGQTTTRFAFHSVSAAGGSPTAGNFLDGVTFTTPTCLNTAKSVEKASGSPGTQVKPGDILEYTFTTTNTGPTATVNATLHDPVPNGTQYVPASTTLNGTAVPDAGGGFPYAGSAPVNSPAAAPGVLAPGGTAVVRYQVQVGANVPSGGIENCGTAAAENVIQPLRSCTLTS